MTKENFLGIDFGKSKIGIAIAPEGLLATGFLVVPNNRDFFPKLKEIINGQDVKNVVIGVPFSMDGSESESTKATREFISNIKEAFPERNIFTYDERLTTQEAKRNLSSPCPSGRRGKPNDAEAARIILQGFLDKQKNDRKGKIF